MFDPHCTMVDLEPYMHTAVRVDCSLVYPCFLTLVCVSVCVRVSVCVCLCVCALAIPAQIAAEVAAPLSKTEEIVMVSGGAGTSGGRMTAEVATGEPAPTSRPRSDWSGPIKGNG